MSKENTVEILEAWNHAHNPQHPFYDKLDLLRTFNSPEEAVSQVNFTAKFITDDNGAPVAIQYNMDAAGC